MKWTRYVIRWRPSVQIHSDFFMWYNSNIVVQFNFQDVSRLPSFRIFKISFRDRIICGTNYKVKKSRNPHTKCSFGKPQRLKPKFFWNFYKQIIAIGIGACRELKKMKNPLTFPNYMEKKVSYLGYFSISFENNYFLYWNSDDKSRYDHENPSNNYYYSFF